MAVTISAALVGAAIPRLVQVTVEGLSVGDDVRVLGVLGGFTWDVRGAVVVASSSQLVRLDDLTPVNRPVTYRVEVEGITVATSDPVTVPFESNYLLSAVDGSVTVVPSSWTDNALPVDPRVDQHFTVVPGRANPVLRFALAGGVSGQWVLRTDRANSERLFDLLSAGAPVVLRTDGQRRDLPPVRVVALSAGPSSLWGGDGGVSTQRTWELSWIGQDDPLSDQPVPGDTFADVDAAYEGDTFADLDAAYEGNTFGDWNRTDWAGMAAS